MVGGFLLEGLCDRAKPYLDQLSALLDEISTQGIATYKYFGENIQLTEELQIFTSTLLIRYELYQAHYSYLTNNPEEAWERLRKSETHVNLRLMKYSLIDEISQATFEPHYRLLARIYFLRAQILMFAPFTAPISRSTPSINLPTDVEHRNGLRTERSVHISRLYLLEKARLYAACDGDSELYACITAYQCCIYLIASEAEVMPIKFEAQTFTLNQEQAKDWARQLRDAALLAYTEAGRHHYYQIKEKSGISEDRHHNFGKFTIDAIPTIREIQGGEGPGITEFDRRNGQPPERVLHLDMEILGLDKNLIRGIEGQERGETVYLFGTNACYLFFARGMYHLCSEDTHEFGSSETVKSLKDWKDKLDYAYRLFSYAWAIADNGGHITKDETNAIRIERRFKVPDNVQDLEKDVASIQDLYPHRITDIASLGRLYAAACIVLQGYTKQNKKERQNSSRQLKWLLNNLHSEDSCKERGTQNILGSQKRYNEHLAVYLWRCRRHLEKCGTRLSQKVLLVINPCKSIGKPF